MFLSNITRRPGRWVAGIKVVQEDVFQAWFVRTQGDHGVLSGRIHHRVGRTLYRNVQRPAAVCYIDPGDAWQGREGVGRNRRGEDEGELLALDVLDLGHPADACQAPLADDGHLIT